MAKVSVLLVGKGPPDTGGISAMLGLLIDRLGHHFETGFLNLTRDRPYTAGTMTPANVIRTFTDVLRLFRTARGYDVVYFHSAFTPAVTVLRAGVLLVAAGMRGAATVLHIHGGGLPDWTGSAWKRLLLRVALTTADVVISVSDAITASLPSDRVVTIYNGVDTEVFSPAEKENDGVPVILYAGLLTKRKGVIDLIEASRLLRERAVPHRLVLVGGTPDEGEDAEREVRRTATGFEEFVGAVAHEDMPAQFRAADVFCLPSWFEAMPLSILEAMSSGLPVVASRVGQVPDLLGDDTGELVEPGDLKGLADALETLVLDHALRRRLGKEARNRVIDEFSADAMLTEIQDILRHVAGHRRNA